MSELYGQPRAQRLLWAKVTSAATDLRGQLQALQHEAHHHADPDVVEAVRSGLWKAHALARNPISATDTFDEEAFRHDLRVMLAARIMDPANQRPSGD